MAVPENRRGLNTLPIELKIKLGFQNDSTGNWLFCDEFDRIGSLEVYEWLPTRLRVSADGTRYEAGAWKQDIEGLLSLAAIVHPEAKGLEDVIKFWTGHKKFSVVEEPDLLFIGTNLEPTPPAFEKEYKPVLEAYRLALIAAINNLNYQDLAAHSWYGVWLEYAENPLQQTILFSTLEEVMGLGSRPKEIDPEVQADREKMRAANTLRDFPLATYRTSLHFAPATVVRAGISKEFSDGTWLVAHNGRDPKLFEGEETVDLFIDNTKYNHQTERWEKDGVNIHLQIPYGVTVETINDMVKLNKAKVYQRDQEGRLIPVGDVLDVNVVVGDDIVQITAANGSLSVELRKPTCNGCKIPYWQFPFPTEEEMREEKRNEGRVFRAHSVNTNAGIYRCLLKNGNGTENTYCFHCVKKVENKYAQAHPFVLRSRAVDVVRARLNNAGYSDVKIIEDQVWRTESLGAKGWEIFTQIVYDRDGRRIIRHTGIPVLLDTGKFISNMLPREYVTFRYQ